MTRLEVVESESASHAPFVGVVVSIAGILLVLVTVVADRAWQSVADLASQNVDLAATRQASQTLEGDVNRLAAEMNTIRAESAARKLERDRLITMLTAVETELGARRGGLEAEDRKQFDLQRDLAQARADLERLDKQRKETQETPNKSIKVENFPTPLSKPVDNKEVHFQLKYGRLTFVPLDAGAKQAFELAREKTWKLQDASEFTDTFGPIDGFTIRYKVVRHDASWEEAVQTGRGRTILEFEKVEFLPLSAQLGEPVQEALANRSAFHGRLDDLNAKHTTVTVWVYPDSFGEFRHVRKHLYQRGFSVAARPLSDGMLIGGSSHGSKSAAE